MAFAAILTVFLGFAPSYYLRSFTHATNYPTGVPVSPSLPPLIHLHALAFSLWILFFIAQITLVSAGRVDIHRRLGIFGAVLAPLMTVLGFLTAIRGARSGWNPGGPFPDSLAFMFVGVADILVFSSFVAAGFYYRRRPEIHKRLILLATMGGLMWPAITRMPYVAGRPALMLGLLAALVLASAVRDFFSCNRVHPVSLWGGLLILGTFPFRPIIARTEAWRHIASWLIR